MDHEVGHEMSDNSKFKACKNKQSAEHDAAYSIYKKHACEKSPCHIKVSLGCTVVRRAKNYSGQTNSGPDAKKSNAFFLAFVKSLIKKVTRTRRSMDSSFTAAPKDSNIGH